MTTDAPPSSEHQNIRNASLISLATMASRVLGLVREHLFAKLMGVGVYSDAFIMAYRIPNLLRELVAEGALSSAFVPVFADTREKQGDAAALRLAQVVFTGLWVLGSVLIAAGLWFAPQLIDTFASGFRADEEKRSVTIALTRWLMPFLLLAAWAALCRGILNSYGQYFLPALSPIYFNLLPIAGGVVLTIANSQPEHAVYVWALTFLAGGALAFLAQVPALLRLGLTARLVLALRHPGFLRILRLMLPATLGLAALQINVLVNSSLASRWDEAVSALNYAYRLLYFPVGVIGVAIATVTAVEVSRQAARENLVEMRRGLAAALRTLAFLTVPGAAGLIVLSEPIVRLIFDYGRFAEDPDNVLQTARALDCYSWGLFFFCGVKVVAPTFYALDRIRVPVIASVAAVVMNIAWSTSTAERIGFETLAIGTAVASTTNFVILVAALVLLLGGFPYRELARSFALTVLLTAAMAVAVGSAAQALERALGTETLTARLATVGLPMAIAGLIVVGGGAWIGSREARNFLSAVARRWRA